MTRQLEITDSQRQSSDRHNLRAAIYLLSGTFVGRSGVTDAPFYWSTHEVTAFGQLFKPYLAPPLSVARGIGFEPGSEASFPEVRIPVRNLPFAHSESMVAAITDEDFRVENTTATLRVAYLRPGQTASSLADEDWTPLVLDGFLGPADEITLDGLILPLFNRGARRNQLISWPRLPSPETMSGGAIDASDAGTIPPIVVGNPRDWFRVPTMNLGVRGFTSSGFDTGQTAITFRAITVGSENLASGNAIFGNPGISIHYTFPVYEVASAAFNSNTKEFTVYLGSGLAADVPRGAYVQQHGPGLHPISGKPVIHSAEATDFEDGTYFFWALGAPVGSTQISPPVTVDDVDYQFGWLFPDGEVRPADISTWPILLDTSYFDSEGYDFSLSGNGGANMGDGDTDPRFTGGQLIRMGRGIPSAPFVPVYYDPLVNGDQEVTQQPEFTSVESAFGVLNRPSGGSDAGSGSGTNADARDGSYATNVLVENGHSITLTFNSAPAPFANDDTTSSVLHVVCRASTGEGGETAVNVTDGVALTYLEIPVGLGTGEPTEFIVQLPSPADFNQELHFTSNTLSTPDGAARIVEAWWEHSLTTTVSATRTVDVAITSGTVPLGSVMQYADLVMRAPDTGGIIPALWISGGVARGRGFVEEPSPFYAGEAINIPGSPASGFAVAVPYPSSVMVGLHALLGSVEGNFQTTINSGTYRFAHDKYVADNIRLGFVWDERNHPSDWTELERMVAEQSRSFMYYGPSGHELLYLESASGFEALPIVQSFRLPGMPGANTFATGQPLYSRTRTTELVNIYELQWDPDPLTGDYRRSIEKRNDGSIADIGVRRRDQGPATFSLHTPWEANPGFTVAPTLSGMAQFYVDRQAFAATRFAFDTAWIAHGLDRGSLISIAYPVTATSFRGVIAEVESVEVSPINGDRFSIIARSITRPQKGSADDLTWIDVFDDLTDSWTTEILQEFDSWTDYWGTP